jgi:hypothetical protein
LAFQPPMAMSMGGDAVDALGRLVLAGSRIPVASRATSRASGTRVDAVPTFGGLGRSTDAFPRGGLLIGLGSDLPASQGCQQSVRSQVAQAIVPNQMARPRFAAPERAPFKPIPVRVSAKALIWQRSDIRTKMGVVRLCQKMRVLREEKWPRVGLATAARGSEVWPRKPAFCGIPAVRRSRKKSVPRVKTGGGRRTVVKPSPPEISNT